MNSRGCRSRARTADDQRVVARTTQHWNTTIAREFQITNERSVADKNIIVGSTVERQRADAVAVVDEHVVVRSAVKRQTDDTGTIVLQHVVVRSTVKRQRSDNAQVQ